MGFSVNNQCFETKQEALNNYCQSYPILETTNGNLYTFSCTTTSTTQATIQRQTGAGAITNYTTTPQFAPCTTPNIDYEQATLFFSTTFIGIVGLFLGVKAIAEVVKFIRNNTK